MVRLSELEGATSLAAEYRNLLELEEAIRANNRVNYYLVVEKSGMQLEFLKNKPLLKTFILTQLQNKLANLKNKLELLNIVV